MLFAILPTQLAPARTAKQANERHHAAIKSLGLETNPERKPRYAPPPAPTSPAFIGPLDLRKISVRRFSPGDKFMGRKLSGKAEGHDYLHGRKARALRYGDAMGEMAGTIDPLQIGIGARR